MSEHVSTWAALHLALDALEEAEADPDALVDVLAMYASTVDDRGQLHARLLRALTPTAWRFPLSLAETERLQAAENGLGIGEAMLRRLSERMEAAARKASPERSAAHPDLRLRIRVEWVPDPAVVRERARARRGGG